MAKRVSQRFPLRAAEMKRVGQRGEYRGGSGEKARGSEENNEYT